MTLATALRQKLMRQARLPAVARAFSTDSPRLIEDVHEFQRVRRALPAGTRVGLVPTMGGLHAGHLSLVREARKQCDVVAVSVFVNPTQFGPNEDFSKYPRTLENDLKLLKQEGVQLVLFPSADDIYSKNHRCFVDPVGFDDLPEGKCRPGHFRGVATVVTKLLNIVGPTHAFFGQKDAAQCVLIKRLVEDLNMPVHIQVIEIARESDGLAMSTRNQYLNDAERKAASVVYRGLRRARDLFQSDDGEQIGAAELRAAVAQEYASEPLVHDINYISIGSKQTMEELDVVEKNEGAIISVALKLGNCRLIDNITL